MPAGNEANYTVTPNNIHMESSFQISKEDFESELKMLREQYPDEAENALECVFSRPDLCLRVNTLRTTAEELASRLAQNGAECTPNGDSVTVTSGGDRIIEGIGGDYFVQGANSQFAVSLLGAEPGMSVIDVCACPGGKTLVFEGFLSPSS